MRVLLRDSADKTLMVAEVVTVYYDPAERTLHLDGNDNQFEVTPFPNAYVESVMKALYETGHCDLSLYPAEWQ